MGRMRDDAIPDIFGAGIGAPNCAAAHRDTGESSVKGILERTGREESWWDDLRILCEGLEDRADSGQVPEPDDDVDVEAERLAALTGLWARSADDVSGAPTPPLYSLDEPFADVAGLVPGGRAAAEIERALPKLATLPDAHLLDLLVAARRLASWAEGVQMLVAAELHHRPARDEDGTPLRPDRAVTELHQATTVEEIAAKLRVTSGTAAHLTYQGQTVRERFPEAGALLLDGQIDIPKLQALINGTQLLDDDAARWVQEQVLPHMPDLTSGRLRARIARLALQADPELADKKRRAAENDAQMAVWRNKDNSTATFALTNSPVMWALAASAHVDVLARDLKNAGDPRPLGVLRVVVAYTLLLGHDPNDLVPLAADDPGNPGPADGPGPAGQPDDNAPGDAGVDYPKPEQDRADPAGDPGHSQSADSSRQPNGSADSPLGRDRSTVERIVAAGADPARRRTVWLSVPLDTLTGAAKLPGELQGFGPVTAAQARELAGHAVRWVATRARKDSGRMTGGRVILHGQIALHGRGRPQLPRINKAVARVDAPDRPENGYRPSGSLDARVRARDGTCRWPSCNHSAWNCDLDHTIPYHRGGQTRAANLSALHRRHHRIKAMPGIRLAQPSPGTLLWRVRTGDLYLVTPPG